MCEQSCKQLQVKVGFTIQRIRTTFTYSIHVYAICVGPGMLKVLLQPLTQAPWDLVESDELFDSQHLCVVTGRTRVQSLDDG